MYGVLYIWVIYTRVHPIHFDTYPRYIYKHNTAWHVYGVLYSCVIYTRVHPIHYDTYPRYILQTQHRVAGKYSDQFWGGIHKSTSKGCGTFCCDCGSNGDIENKKRLKGFASLTATPVDCHRGDCPWNVWPAGLRFDIW